MTKTWVTIYVCMYIWGFRACQHLRSLAPVMSDEWWPNDIRGPWGPKASWHLSYWWGKPRKKPHPGNLSRPGIEPGPAAGQANMLPPVPQRWTTWVTTFLTNWRGKGKCILIQGMKVHKSRIAIQLLEQLIIEWTKKSTFTNVWT